jgi:hypothetical protein
MESLPGSTLPEELRRLGYVVAATGETERILPDMSISKVKRWTITGRETG